MRRIQTIVALPKLEIALARPIADIPNQENYRLLGIMANGMALPLTVKKDVNGCHYLADQHNTHRLPSAFVSWVPDTMQAQAEKPAYPRGRWS